MNEVIPKTKAFKGNRYLSPGTITTNAFFTTGSCRHNASYKLIIKLALGTATFKATNQI